MRLGCACWSLMTSGQSGASCVPRSQHGYTVFEASSGQEALSAVLSDRPDLIILDLGLPDLNASK
jgi:CheY-like chemotaxis protein